MAYRSLCDLDDPGLRADLERIAALRLRQRRQALNWLLSGGAAALVSACGGGSDGTSSATAGSATSTTSTSTSTSTSTATTATGGGTACVLNATETNGPYPADGTNTLNGMAVNALTQSGIVRSARAPKTKPANMQPSPAT